MEMRPKGYTLSDDDKALWESAMADVNPLPESQKLPPVIAPTPRIPYRYTPHTVPHTPTQITHPASSTAGIDKNTAQRLAQGKYPIDSRLDLHGMTAERALTVLTHFLHTAYNDGRRCVLVITGKGLAGQGIIRASLESWLSSPALRPYILTYTPARPPHGGEGAFYVLVRRRR